jgi:hypothetical protein
MKWTPWLFSSLTAFMIASCGGGAREETGTTGDAGTETGTMQGGTATDTSTTPAGGEMTSDTAHGGARVHGDSTSPAEAAPESDTARVTPDSAAKTTQ